MNMVPSELYPRVIMNPRKARLSPLVPIQALKGYTIMDFLLKDPKAIEAEFKWLEENIET